MPYETSIVIAQAALVVLVTIAAALDLRSGKIPNWLTFSALAIGPIYWFAAVGTMGAIESVAGIFLCGLAPFMAYRVGGMPGGDLKLFAAIGGLVLPVAGIEIQFFSMVAAGIFGVGVLISRGRFRETFGQALIRLRNRMVPEKWHREVPEIERTSIRIGPFVLVGVALVIAEHFRLWREVLGG